MEQFGGWLQQRLAGETGPGGAPALHRGLLLGPHSSSAPVRSPSWGSLNYGLGNGADQLFLKATLDGFAAMAFAASFGLGVAASAVTIVVVQGGLTLVGVLLGDVLSDATLAAITATGGLLLVGVALRLLPDPGDSRGEPAPCPARRAGGCWRRSRRPFVDVTVR